MSFQEYSDFDAIGLRDLIKSGEVSAPEVLSAAFDRISARNPTLNAIVATFDRLAHEQLDLLASAAPEQDGWSRTFAGVPIAVKDCVGGVRGVSQKFGTRLTQSFTATRDEEIIRRYRDEGVVFAGQTNVPEFSSSITTESVLYGPCRNPWNPALTVGGSSGGSACAVASGMVPVATANDSAGSIRIPASCTGIFGFKPSRGRTPNGPDVSEVWNGLFVQHVVTRSVRDSAAFLDITHGMDVGAPYVAPTFEGCYLDETEKPAESLKVAFSLRALNGVTVDDSCKAAILDTARFLESLGHQVVEDKPELPSDRYFEALENLLYANFAYEFQRHANIQNTEISSETVEACHRKMIDIGKDLPAMALMEFFSLKALCERQMGAFFEGYDVYLTPSLAQLPVPHGHIHANSSNLREYLDRFWAFSPFTTLANIAGLPSMSVPLYQSDCGLPIGSMFCAGYGQDDRLFRLAGQLERALPWKQRTPPMA